jgi:hypothetical protein
MLRRKYLVVIVIVCLILTAYFLRTNIKAETSLDISAVSMKSVSKDSSSESLINDENPPQLKQNEVKTLSCATLDIYNKIDKKNRAAFISTKAVQWYFDGFDKYKIAETLAATFSYSIAMQWIESINSLSRNHEKHTQLIQTIDSFSYTSDFVRSSKYMRKIYQYQLPTIYDEKIDINQRFNQYPDLAIHHWSMALGNALQNKKIDDAINAIKQLKTYIKEPQFFQHPIKKFNLITLLTSLSQLETDTVIEALFDLSPVIAEKNNRYVSTLKQMLTGLDVDESLWKFKQVNTNDFEVDSTISQLIDKAQNEYPSLNKRPVAENVCVGENQYVELKKIKVTTFNKQKSIQQLSPAWQNLSSTLCPEKTIFNGYFAVNKKLHAAEIILADLVDFESLQKNSKKLSNAIANFDEYERTILFNLIYMNKRFEVKQIKELINLNIAPTNSDFYSLLRQLPLTQQKELLVEHQYNLTHSNNFGFSIIANVLQFGNSNHIDELIPFLLEQGFPLKESESSLDPLWWQLHLISVSNRYKELPLRSISSLIDHTTLNETHIDIMYKIKQKNIEVYENLIEQYPELKFDEPEELIEISCF